MMVRQESTGRGGTVCVLDAATGDVLGNIKVGARPWGIAISPDGKLLYAANGPSNDISVVDLASEKEVVRIKGGDSPWGVLIVPKGKQGWGALKGGPPPDAALSLLRPTGDFDRVRLH